MELAQADRKIGTVLCFMTSRAGLCWNPVIVGSFGNLFISWIAIIDWRSRSRSGNQCNSQRRRNVSRTCNLIVALTQLAIQRIIRRWLFPKSSLDVRRYLTSCQAAVVPPCRMHVLRFARKTILRRSIRYRFSVPSSIGIVVVVHPTERQKLCTWNVLEQILELSVLYRW